MEDTGFVIGSFPTPNFEIEMGANFSVRFVFNEKRTLIKRLKWWLFCKFFPFRIVKWDREVVNV